MELHRIGIIAPNDKMIRDCALLGLADAYASLNERSLLFYCDQLPAVLEAVSNHVRFGDYADQKVSCAKLLMPLHYLQADLVVASRTDLYRINALDPVGQQTIIAAFNRDVSALKQHQLMLMALPPDLTNPLIKLLIKQCQVLLVLIDPGADDEANFIYACLRLQQNVRLLWHSPAQTRTKEIADGQDQTLLAFRPIVLDRVLRDEHVPLQLNARAFSAHREVYVALAKTLQATNNGS